MAYGLTQSLDLEASSSQYATAADSASLSFTGNWTAEGWIKLESLPSGTNYGFIGKGDDGSENAYSFRYRHLGASVYDLSSVYANTGGSVTREASYVVTLSTATWIHVAISWVVATGAYEFIINGSVAASGTGVGAATSVGDTSATFYLGRDPFGSGRYMDGKMSLWRIWNTNRSAAQIAANMCNVFGTSTTNMQAEWSLNNVYTDASGNSNTLTPSGSPVFSVDVPATCTVSPVNSGFFFAASR